MNSDSIQCCDLPEEIPIRLYPHQRTSLAACMRLEHYTNVTGTQLGVLTDRSGSGKSFVILSLVFFKKYPHLVPPSLTHDLYHPYLDGPVHSPEDGSDAPNNTTVIVVSHGLLSQWTQYAKLFDPLLKTFVVSQYVNMCTLCTQGMNEYDIIIVTNTLYPSFAMSLFQKNIKVMRLVIDDADELLNNNHVTTRSNFYWFIVSSDLHELTFDVLSYTVMIDHSFMTSVIVRNEDSFILDSFEHRTVRTTNIMCTLPQGSDQHGQLMWRSIRTLLERGDVKGAVGKLDKKQLKPKDEMVSLVNNDNKCSICYDDITVQSMTPCCTNSFCFKCIGRWLVHSSTAHTSCPLCRAPLSIQQILVEREEREDGEEHSPVSEETQTKSIESLPSHGKLDSFRILMHKLSSDPNSKVLVFVMNPYTMMNVKTVMTELHIANYRLRGNNRVINTNVMRFNKDDGVCKALIICPMTANTGISLPKTTDIVFFDVPGNLELETRMIGRAHRLGRKEQLRIWNISYDLDVLDRHRDITTLQSVEEVELADN